jgi:hypothetical protein
LSDAPEKIGAAGLIAAAKRKRGASANAGRVLIVDQHRIVDQKPTLTRRSGHSHHRHQRLVRSAGPQTPLRSNRDGQDLSLT